MPNLWRTGEDTTKYRLVSRKHVRTRTFAGKPVLVVDPEGLALLAREAMRDALVSPAAPKHLQQVAAAILETRRPGQRSRSSRSTMLKNADVASRGLLPFCQDTGTATIVRQKGPAGLDRGGNDEESSRRASIETYTEKTCATRRPPPLDHVRREEHRHQSARADRPLCRPTATSTSSSSSPKAAARPTRPFSYQETKALLNPTSLEKFLTEKMKTLGTAACPPYHLAFVIGGTSAEATLKPSSSPPPTISTSCRPPATKHGRAFRDVELESEDPRGRAQAAAIGAQFGGKYFALDVRVIRLPRHGASCPSASASPAPPTATSRPRSQDGIWLEELETQPGRSSPRSTAARHRARRRRIDLNRPMEEILRRAEQVSRHHAPPRSPARIIVARDIAHAKLKELLDRGEAAAATTSRTTRSITPARPRRPPGMPSGSFGPTTAGRMDTYVDLFQSHGGSLIMIAKGNRSQQVTDACKKHGGFYLGRIGGPAAILAKENIKKVEVVEFPELGMEAIWKIEVEDFPAFILVDDKGNDFLPATEVIPVCGPRPLQRARINGRIRRLVLIKPGARSTPASLA